MLNKGFLKLFIFTFISFSILSSCQFFSDEKKAAANSSTTVATPVITPASGAVVSGTEANITSETAGASIYYTIDGNNPTTSSTLYSTPIIINSALTIKAIAVKDGMTNSSISSGQYTIAQDTAFTPSYVTHLAGATGGPSSYSDGTGAAARFFRPTDITSDGTNLYVADTDNNIIRKIVISTGVVTTIAGSATEYGNTNGTGANARFHSPRSITTDGTNLYVTEYYSHAIRKIIISTAEVTTLAGVIDAYGSDDGIGEYARFHGPSGITNDGTNLYVADLGNRIIRKIVILTNEVSTFAGTAGNYGSDDGIGAVVKFGGPTGITTDGINLYITDPVNQRIRKIVIATGQVSTLDLFGEFYSLTTDGTSLYVTDYSNDRIKKIIIATGETSTLAGTKQQREVAASFGAFRNLSFGDGFGLDTIFNSPLGITMAGSNLYVADTYNNTIRKIIITSAEVSTLAGSAIPDSGAIDATGSDARFQNPMGMTSDGINLYVADSGNHTIRKIVIATGATTTLAGSAGNYGSDDGFGTNAKFNFPAGITIVGTNLYVVDRNNSRIRKIVIATGEVSTFAGSVYQSAGFKTLGSGDGTGLNAIFYQPIGITTDGTNLYVTDTGSNTIRKIVIETREVTTIAGAEQIAAPANFNIPSILGLGDGIGAEATFNEPWGITTDGTNLYVSEYVGSVIRKIVISTGEVTTLAGTACAPVAAGFNGHYDLTSEGTNNLIRFLSCQPVAAGFAGIYGAGDGTGADASFSRLMGITSDGTNLYVTEPFNNTIRKIVIETGVVTTLTGTIEQAGIQDGTLDVATFNGPSGIFYVAGKLFISEGGNNDIRKIE